MHATGALGNYEAIPDGVRTMRSQIITRFNMASIFRA